MRGRFLPAGLNQYGRWEPALLSLNTCPQPEPTAQGNWTIDS